MSDEMPCGESGCYCQCQDPDGHACGCDCWRCDECMQHAEYCHC